MSDKPLILIVDDDEAIRGSLHMLFESVMLESRTFDSAAALLADLPEDFAQLRPGALVLDVRMPGMSGLELLDVLTACGFALPILLISGHGDVEMAVEAMKRGACDFLEKPFKDQHLLDRVECALRRSRELLARANERRLVDARLARLNRREREVIDHVLAGQLNREIAEELELSVKTIEAYRSAAMAKMEVGSAVELARLLTLYRSSCSAPGMRMAPPGESVNTRAAASWADVC